MTRIAVVLATLSFALAGSAFAQSATPASPGSAAPPSTANTAAAPAPAAKSVMPTRHHMRHMAALRHDTNAPQEGRETKALNLLEAKGYGTFKDFHRDGLDYDATVTTNGRPFQIMVNPDSGRVINRT